ncbi:hypothetical protein [Vibrio nitrifigilis]|uniref:Lipoprotein n=1 Tax=Vibrio nitrifigilis TaxID=2789781 RepID=A0ABS0GDJ2_9VIBR|nr:hypothetical protein [Vibrio nitrifigilis]MBF9000440.1 hypothetical protein [Vibrio nitrifigilis]
MYKFIWLIGLSSYFSNCSNAVELNTDNFPNLKSTSTSTYSYTIGKSVIHSDYSIIFDSFLGSDGNTSCVIPVYDGEIENKYCLTSAIDYSEHKMKQYFYAVNLGHIDIQNFTDKDVKVNYSSVSSVKKHKFIFNKVPVLSVSGKVEHRATCSLSIDDISDPEFPVLNIESTICELGQ